MERRRALAVALAGTGLVISGALMAAALARQDDPRAAAILPSASVASPTSGVAPGTTALPVDPEVVTVVSEVEDRVVVPRPAGAPAASAASPVVSNEAPAGGDVGSPAAAPSGPSPTTAGAGAPVTTTPTTRAPASTTTTTARPATTTTTRPSTTTTLPPGVPADWPPGKPIPPMPAGCKQPQLEDNGVWNCQH